MSENIENQETIVIEPENQENYDATVAAIRDGKITWREITRDEMPAEMAENTEIALLIKPSKDNKWTNQFTCGFCGIIPEKSSIHISDENKTFVCGIIHEALIREGTDETPGFITATIFVDDNDKEVAIGVREPKPAIMIAHLEKIKDGSR